MAEEKLRCPGCHKRYLIRSYDPKKTYTCRRCGEALAPASGLDSPVDAAGSGDPVDDPLIGRQIEQYRILGKLGEGGMGVVYKAEHVELLRLSALKVLPEHRFKRSPKALRRFLREARSAAALSHPNIVVVYNVGEAEGMHFIEMQFIDGESVQDRLAREGKLSVEDATRIVLDTARALTAAHASHIVHRDIKPANILLDGKGHVRVADFGLAKNLDDDSMVTEAGKGGLGTAYFMSPEQCDGGTLDGRSDIYSLGVTYFYLLTGELPFNGDTSLSVMLKHRTDPVPDPRLFVRSLPETACRIIAKAMAKRPEDRYQTGREMVSALDGVMTEETPFARTLVMPQRARHALDRVRHGLGAMKRGWLIASASALALALIVAAMWPGPKGEPTEQPAGQTAEDIQRASSPKSEPTERPAVQTARDFYTAGVTLLNRDPEDEAGARHLRRAMELDKSLAKEVGEFYYDLAKRILAGGDEPAYRRLSQLAIAADPSCAKPVARDYLALGCQKLAQPRDLHTGIRYLSIAAQLDGTLTSAICRAQLDACESYLAQGDVQSGIAAGQAAIRLDKTQDEKVGETYLKHGRRLKDADDKKARALLERCAAMGVAASPATRRLLEEGQPAPMPLAEARIAFSSDLDGNRDIYAIKPGGTGLNRLTDDPADDRHPNWSPDGRTIVFSSKRTGDGDIYAMDADGSNIRRLTHAPGWEVSPVFSPDGKRIAYSTHGHTPRGLGEVWVMDADGSNKRQVTTNRVDDCTPTWSADGSSLAFVRIMQRNWTFSSEIFRVDLASGRDSRLTQTAARGEDNTDWEPRWSPKRDTIAWESGRTGVHNIWLMDADGNNKRQLTRSNLDWLGSPSWSPEADRIAFIRNSKATGKSEIWLINVDGSAEQKLLAGDANYWDPAWGPAASPGKLPPQTPGQLWSNPRKLFPDTALAGEGGPSLLQLRDGKLVAAFGRQMDILWTVSRDEGRTWEPARSIVQPRYRGISSFVTQCADGKIWVLWCSAAEGDYDVYCRSTADLGKTWSDRVWIKTPFGHSSWQTMLEPSDGRLWIVWGNSYVESDDGGASWSSVRRLEALTDMNLSMLSDSRGRLWAVSWTGGSAQAQTSDDRGLTWSAATALGSASSGRVTPRLCEDAAGRIWVAWHSNHTGQDCVYCAYSADRGESWRGPLPIGCTAQSKDEMPDLDIVAVGQTVRVVWQKQNAGRHELWWVDVRPVDETRVPRPGPPKRTEAKPVPENVVADPVGNLRGDSARSFLDIVQAALKLEDDTYTFSVVMADAFPPKEAMVDKRIDIIWFVDIDRNRRTGQSGLGNEYNIHLALTRRGWHWIWYKVTQASRADGVKISRADLRISVHSNEASLSFPKSYLPSESFDWWAYAGTLNAPKWPPRTENPDTARATFDLTAANR